MASTSSAEMRTTPTFADLRAEAMRHVQELSVSSWTDHNTHDPGITILEQLCYVLSDLAYRCDFDMKDLLAEAAGAAAGPGVFRPSEILTSHPVTVTDLRKVVIDVEGVKNAWIEPAEQLEPALFYDPTDRTLYLRREAHRVPVVLRGVHRVLIAADGTVPDLELTRNVRRRLHACRNLGEDFEPPVILPRQKVGVEVDLEIGEVDDPALLLAQVYAAIAEHVSPGVTFLTLAEMLGRGRALDEILNGPILDHGFIDDRELEGFKRAPGIRTSDVIRVLMALKGIRAVQEIHLTSGSNREDWYLVLNAIAAPELDVEAGLAGNRIRLRRGKLALQPDVGAVRRHLARLMAIRRPRRLELSERDRPIPTGRPRHVERYHSFQHHLPKVYGMGEAGLPDGVSGERRAQARQLKAYLLFFDQVLANCFGQAAHAGSLFACPPGETRTYFSQLPAGVPRADEVLDPTLDAVTLQRFTESPETARSRRDRFLNHLLARFGEGFSDFAILDDGQRRGSNAVDDAERRLAAKAAFLADFPATGAGRGRGFDYSRPSWDNENVSGLERRIARKLGLVDGRRRSLAGLDERSDGGFHLVEHILMRPRKSDAESWQTVEGREWRAYGFLAGPEDPDPYSARISFVFPGWLERFRGQARSHVERILVEEVPAHLRFRVLWFGAKEMAAFEDAFRVCLATLQELS